MTSTTIPPRSDIIKVEQKDSQHPAFGLGVASIVLGALSIFLLPIIFAPIALTLGIIAVAKGYRWGWLGIVLSGLALSVLAYNLYQFSQAMEELSNIWSE